MPKIQFIFLLFALALFACTRYDVSTPDTSANRAGFEQRLGVKPTADVKGVYFYADELGGDVKFQLRFECSQKTIDAIASHLGLTAAAPPENRLRGRDDLGWWKEQSLKALACYWKADGQKYFRFLWYDAAKGEAFYLEYSM